MSRQHCVTVFKFGELSESAKAKAREWYRRASDGDTFWSECVIDDAQQIAALMGISIDTARGTKSQPAIYFSGFSSQGDGACFEGSWSADKVKTGEVKAHAPQDKELHRIASEFEAFAKSMPDASFTVKHSGHYSHSHSTSFSFDFPEPEGVKYDSPKWKQWEDDCAAAETALTESARDLMDWIYRQLEKEYEYQNSDEVIAENIEANEYEFTDDGARS